MLKINAETASAIKEAVPKANELFIANQYMAEKTAKELKNVRELLDTVHLAGDKGVKRWYDGHKMAVARLKQYLNPLETAEKILKIKISIWVTTQDGARKNQERNQGIELPPVLPPSGLHTRTTWDFTVIDESLVPKEYWELNLTKIKQTVTEKKGETNIPGIQAFSKSMIY